MCLASEVLGSDLRTPAKDHAAEAEAIFNDGQELLLGYDLAPEYAIDVHSGHLDLVIFLQDGLYIFEGDLGFFTRHVVSVAVA